ncbi:MAG: clostripain-related cysteine peptidase [Deltaproteobacteria bacterium]|nr:clostripain-related cysteine peptidase [Deltaproteobacteria bacterium]
MTKRKDFRILRYGLLILAFSLISCGGGGGGGGNDGGGTTDREWTYMVYMGADNNLSSSGEGDIAEMATVGSTSGVAVVVQAEFSQQYSGTGVPADTRRMLIQKGADNIAASTSIGNVNMADPATLTAFIKWAQQAYPAKHYALVIWDHGAGWKEQSLGPKRSIFRGAVQDTTSDSFMSLPDLAKGVRDSGVHFDVVNFDACLMAMYEVAYEFKGLTDYMVFSEETEPGEGDPYDTILTSLTGNPAMSGRNLAGLIVDKYDEFYTANNRGATTKSAVDMSQMDALDAKILALSAALQTDAAANALFQAAQSATQHYTYPSNHDLYDLCSYVAARLQSGAAKDRCNEILTIINGMVINNKINDTSPTQVAGSHGLAIYLPTASETNSTDLGLYAKLACNKVRASASGTWGSYVDYLLGAGGGNVEYVKGGFGLYLYWEKADGSACDADLDLYIWEPAADFAATGNGDWYSPWMGQTSPNGFFSQDSADSGVSEEFYMANNQVYAGDYKFVVNYWDNGPGCSQARAHLWLYDPKAQKWFELTSANVGFSMTYPSPHVLDLSNVYTSGCDDSNLLCYNNYSDWWVPDALYPAKNSGAGPAMMSQAPPTGSKKTQMIFRFRKGMRLFSDTP